MIRTKLLAMSLAMSALALTPAAAQDWGRHRGHDHGRRNGILRFDPPSMTLRAGERGHFHVAFAHDPTHLHDVRVVSTDDCVRVIPSGDGFDVVAEHAGSFRLIAEHGRGWRTARADMMLNVIECESLLTRIEILDARSGQDIGNEVLTLAPGARVDLRAVGLDQNGQSMRIGPRWDVSSPNAGHVHVGRSEVTLVTGMTTCPHTIHAISASDGNVTTTLRYRIFDDRPVVAGLSRIDLVQVTRWGSQAVGGVIHARRGEQISLQAVGVASDGQAMRFEDRWSLSTNQLGHLHRGQDGSMVLHLDTAYRGTVVVVVRDAASGIGQQVQVVIN